MIEEEGLNGPAGAAGVPSDDRTEAGLPGQPGSTAVGSSADASSGREELVAMSKAYDALEILSQDRRNSAMQWLARALQVDYPTPSAVVAPGGAIGQHGKEPEKPPTPREFISRKKPGSQVERVACLAYFLAKYRGIQNFKAGDIVALNTEAAAPKFGNASRDLDNADRQYGYIVSSGSGAKQMTVRGEMVVEALPDREAVDQALAEHVYRRKRSAGGARKGSRSSNGDESE